MANANNTTDTNDRPPEQLSSIYTRAVAIQEMIDNGTMKTIDELFQKQIKEGIKILEAATMMINDISLFSSNETIDEIATADMKYLIIPALLGSFSAQLLTDDENRIDQIQKSKVYFVDFLKRCDNYEISTTSIRDNLKSELLTTDTSSYRHTAFTNDANIKLMAAERNSKIARYKEKKIITEKIKSLTNSFSQDDDTSRSLTIANIQLWMNRALDEINMIEEEIKMIEFGEKLEKNPQEALKNEVNKPKMKPTKPPLVITKDMIQNKVFGGGYPSQPTMTVEEWHDQRIREGVIQPHVEPRPQKDMSNWIGRSGQEELVDSNNSDDDKMDDENELKKKREFDEFKDENRKGSGNRKNMG